MPYNDEAKEVLAMMAAYHELKYAIEAGKPSSTAGSSVAMLERAIEARMDTEERMLKWMEASCDARQRMMKAHRRTT